MEPEFSFVDAKYANFADHPFVKNGSIKVYGETGEQASLSLNRKYYTSNVVFARPLEQESGYSGPDYAQNPPKIIIIRYIDHVILKINVNYIQFESSLTGRNDLFIVDEDQNKIARLQYHDTDIPVPDVESLINIYEPEFRDCAEHKFYKNLLVAARPGFKEGMEEKIKENSDDWLKRQTEACKAQLTSKRTSQECIFYLYYLREKREETDVEKNYGTEGLFSAYLHFEEEFDRDCLKWGLFN